MPNPNIFIEGIDTDGKLILSDKGKTEVDSKSEDRKITWKIKGGSNPVQSLKLTAITSPAYPFDDPIPTDFEDEVKLKVTKDSPLLDWEYCITWKDEHGVEHKHDPLIAIRPSVQSF